MRKLHLLTTLLATFGLTVGASAQLLTNGDFESGDLSGWTETLSGGSAVISNAYFQSGTTSLLIDNTGAGGWASPNVSQSFAASPGDIFNFQGYMLAPTAIDDGSFGLLKIEFRDSGGNLLVPASADVGVLNTSAFPGVESQPFLNDTSATESWLFTEAQGEAPVGTAEVGFFVLNVNPPGAATGMHFDNLSATQVPEPGVFALLGGFAALGYVFFRRRKKVAATA